MNAVVVAASLAAAAAALLARPASRRLPTPALLAAGAAAPEPPQQSGPAAGWARGGAVGLAGVAVAWLVGDGVGVVVGVVTAGWLWWLLGRAEPARARRARRRRARQLPVVVDLLAAGLAAGVGLGDVAELVAGAVGEPTAADLRRVAAATRAGAPSDEAWSLAAEDLAPVGRALARSATTGAPTAELLRALGVELRARRRAAALDDARRLGVRTAGPLGLCFLPGFVLLGVVPLVVGLVGRLG